MSPRKRYLKLFPSALRGREIDPNAFGEKAALGLMFSATIRATEH
ncbi:MAG: hypothetical protein OXB97_15060 [Rhodospirillales bacterium]|nr:hypothetical protein [Rhodospirillales bacterium]